MKLPTFSRVIQVAANVGVIVSIIFLAIEIRQNSALTELAQLQSTTVNRVAGYTLPTNPQLAEIIGRTYNSDATDNIDLWASEGAMLEGHLFSYLETI